MSVQIYLQCLDCFYRFKKGKRNLFNVDLKHLDSFFYLGTLDKRISVVLDLEHAVTH